MTTNNENLTNISINKMQYINNSGDSLLPIVEKNFGSILVIIFMIPFTVIMHFNIKLSNLKTNSEADKRQIKGIENSLDCIYLWFTINILLFLYIFLLKPHYLPYNQGIQIITLVGFLLSIFSVSLVCIGTILRIYRKIMNLFSYFYEGLFE